VPNPFSVSVGTSRVILGSSSGTSRSRRRGQQEVIVWHLKRSPMALLAKTGTGAFPSVPSPFSGSVGTSRVVLGSSSGTSRGRRWRFSRKLVMGRFRVCRVHSRCPLAPPGSSWGRRRGPQRVADGATRENSYWGVPECAESMLGVLWHLPGRFGVVVGDLERSPMAKLAKTRTGAFPSVPSSSAVSGPLASPGSSWGRRRGSREIPADGVTRSCGVSASVPSPCPGCSTSRSRRGRRYQR